MPHSCSPPSFTLRVALLSLAVYGLFTVLGSQSYANPAEAQASPKRPNIVFILADDLGWADLGIYGSTFHETPALDRLAEQGLRFSNAYAACNVCSPTRASLITGQYPARLNLTNFLVGRREGNNSPVLTAEFVHRLPAEAPSIAQRLNELGYVTGFFGKWHLGQQDSSPKNKGFQHVRHSAGPGKPEGEVETTDAAIAFLQENRDQPFFLYLPYNDVHIPLRPAESQVEQFRDKVLSSNRHNNPVYAAVLQNLDTNVGRVLETIDQLGLADNTIVIFTSDNGGLTVKEGANTPATSNAPLRAGKGHNYEGGIRVPLIVRAPGITQAGTVSDTPVISNDLFKTFVQLAGETPRNDDGIDGVSLVPLLQGDKQLDREALYWHYPHFSNQGGFPSGAVRKGDFKLIEFYEDNRVELYNLAEDVSEQRNLAPQQPEKAQELLTLLRNWRSSVGANMPRPNPEYVAP